MADERYVHGGDAAFDQILATRTAASSAAFFTPRLRTGMRVLDAGCGLGSISVGFAPFASEVVGIDADQRLVTEARALGAELRIANARFEVADVYKLPFADASFDAVFAHTLFVHLAEPARAARELRRVLAPGGIIGLRDPDEGATLIGPSSSPVRRAYDVLLAALAAAHGQPTGARDHRALLLAAGCSRVEADAQVVAFGTRASTRRAAAVIEQRLRSPRVHAYLRDTGGVGELDALCAAVRAWADQPDAFMAVTMCTALGWA